MILIGFIAPFTDWWDSLTTAKQLFYGIGLAAGAMSLVLAVLAVLGLDHDDAIDAVGAGHDSDGIVSLKSITGFFLGFGLAGGMALDAGLSLIVAMLIACAAGAVVVGVMVAMYRAIRSMKSDGTMRVSDAVGAIGTVYITVPPQKAQGGQVVVNFSGRQETFAALSAAEHAIASGEKVRVISIVDTRTVMVEPL
jgi:membrane protein implicated in regulation of membrane protease activity